MELREIKKRLKEIALEYPEQQHESQLEDVDRIAFNLSLVLDHTHGKGRLCDIGGGIGMFSVGAAALGMQTVLVDDFADPVNTRVGESAFAVHRKYGVEIVSADVIGKPLDFPRESFDAITAFDTMEHWHHSPRRLFADVRTFLKDGGQFVIGGPNNVNLRKRLTVPLGRGTWSLMSDWYEQERFRGHVREPNVGDLRYIANDMKLKNVRIVGRNWHGLRSKKTLTRLLSQMTDPLLRMRPSVCSDIYMIGYK